MFKGTADPGSACHPRLHRKRIINTIRPKSKKYRNSILAGGH